MRIGVRLARIKRDKGGSNENATICGRSTDTTM